MVRVRSSVSQSFSFPPRCIAHLQSLRKQSSIAFTMDQARNGSENETPRHSLQWLDSPSLQGFSALLHVWPQFLPLSSPTDINPSSLAFPPSYIPTIGFTPTPLPSTTHTDGTFNTLPSSASHSPQRHSPLAFSRT